jgi:hypothetical protein
MPQSEQYRRSHAPELLEKLKRVRRLRRGGAGDRELFWDKAPGIKVEAPDTS